MATPSLSRGRVGSRRSGRVHRFVSALLVAGIALAVAPAASAQELSDAERRMTEWVDAHVEEAIDLLERTVNINSGTMNHAGVREVGEVMRPQFEALGFETEWIDLPGTDRAGHLFARREGDRGPKILLIGHLDTVFEEGDAFQTFVRDGDVAHGPGVADMKAGNVAILYTLKALDQVGALEGARITVALIGDEESPGEPLELARRDLIAAGEWADVALGFEGMVRDEQGQWITIARRSASEWFLEVTGRQAHSSGVFSEGVGAGAIFEAARILNAFYEEVKGEQYLTFNAGTIVGGTEVAYDREATRGTAFGKTNVVPQRVVVHGGLRTISVEQLGSARARMREVVERHLPQTDATITFTDGYPPMAPTEGNRRLADLYGQVSEELGLGSLQILDPGRRGAADISFVAQDVDGLAGVGVIGRGSHSHDEQVELSSIGPAVQRAAVFLHRLTGASDGG